LSAPSDREFLAPTVLLTPLRRGQGTIRIGSAIDQIFRVALARTIIFTCFSVDIVDALDGQDCSAEECCNAQHGNDLILHFCLQNSSA
jgi:hypothetical protein